MTNVVDLAVAREAREATVEELWDRYIAATQRAQQTLSIDDGIRAGKAWGDFIKSFARETS